MKMPALLRPSKRRKLRRRIEDLSKLRQLAEVGRLIEVLRADEADVVTIAADNADFEGPNSCIDCNGRWTEWEDRRFSGDSLRDCLIAAVAAKTAWNQRNP